MRCIFKEAERPAAFAVAEHTTRLKAARELLPVCASPEFYSLSPQNTLVIAYDGMWFLKNDPINFFVCPPKGTNIPVTPIVGNAVIFRCKPAASFTAEAPDFELQNCTEADLKYVESLLKSGTQHLLRTRYLNDCRGVMMYYSTLTPSAGIILKKLERWKGVHPKEPKDTPIGHGAKVLPNKLPQDETEERIRRMPFSPQKLSHYSERLGFTCTFPYADIILLKKKNQQWKITHEGCLVTKLEVASEKENLENPKGKVVTYDSHHVPNPDIYKLIRFLSI